MVDLLIIRANIYTPRGRSALKGKEMRKIHYIDDGAIAVKDGVIVDVGKTGELFEKYRDAKEIVDAKGRALLPGFVDPHTHAVFVGTRENEFKMRLEGKTYMEILNAGGGILSTVKRVREASKEELAEDLVVKARTFLSYGTTTIEAKSGYGLDFENEVKMLEAIRIADRESPLDFVSTFIGAHAIPLEFKSNKDKYIDIVINEMIPYVAENRLAEFIDVFCEEGVYTPDETLKILEAGLKYGLKPKIHSDEIKSIGCTNLAEKVKIYSCDHLLKLDSSGLEALKKSGTMATLLPGTAFSLKEGFADARRLIDNGVGVALATDFNPGSSYSESMPAIITLGVLLMDMLPEEAFVATTLNAACAIDRGEYIGSIEVGKQADFILLKESSYLFIPYHYGVNPVFETYKRGRRVAHPTDC